MRSRIKNLLMSAFLDRRVNRRAVRIYARLHPPPHRRSNMEFQFDVWNGISTFYASTGRQLGENNTTPGIYRELTETEHRVSKFAGGRRDRWVNMTALRNVLPVWDDALQFTMLLRNHFAEYHGLRGTAMNARQGYAFSKMAAAYVAFLARRRRRPLKDGSVTPVVAGFFTLGVGPFVLVRALMERGDLAALDESQLTAQAWYELAENSGSLLAGTDRACAGSKAMITQFLDVAMNGAYDKPLTSAGATEAFASLDDWDGFYRYLYSSSRLELIVKLNQALIAQALIALQSAPGSLHEDGRRMGRDCLSHCYHMAECSFDDRTTLTHFTAIALALLDELKLPGIAVALQNAGLLDEGGRFELGAGDSSAVGRRIHAITELIYPYCRAELVGVNAALEWADPDPVSIDDLYTRVAGAEIRPLMALLERTSALSVARACRHATSNPP